MFTGIIRNLGTVTAVTSDPDGAMHLTITTRWPEKLAAGDSVAVNGACLTLLSPATTTLQFRLMPETLRKTAFAAISPGTLVNLERPLQLTDRIDGHFVQGHVDGIATVVAKESEGNDTLFSFKIAPDLLSYLISKGSVALDGVSLTIMDIKDDTFRVSMMPYTMEHTAFQHAQLGYRANFEADMLGKYVVSLLKKSAASHTV